MRDTRPRRLALAKQTLRHLVDPELGRVAGGEAGTRVENCTGRFSGCGTASPRTDTD
jgi:hypothetical protein